ncbi:MAG: protease inhibitor I42 family protein [Promethearchaeota archaeon]
MNQKINEVKLGDVFKVSLDSNPSTGYRWEVDFDTDYIKLKEKFYIPLSSKLGAGGKESFSFSTLKHGKTAITMQYKRSWEKKVIKKEIFVIEII